MVQHQPSEKGTSEEAERKKRFFGLEYNKFGEVRMRFISNYLFICVVNKLPSITDSTACMPSVVILNKNNYVKIKQFRPNRAEIPYLTFVSSTCYRFYF